MNWFPRAIENRSAHSGGDYFDTLTLNIVQNLFRWQWTASALITGAIPAHTATLRDS